MVDRLDAVKRGLEIIKIAERQGITIRMLGACAIRMQCPKHKHLFRGLVRPLSDIDLITYSKFEQEIDDMLSKSGYRHLRLGPAFSLIGNRRIYEDKEHFKIDVFFDKLEFCHTLDFRGRLELDYPTITISDLFLAKTQITEITEKDMKDLAVLLREHDLGKNEKEMLNLNYIANLLSSDWGLYFDVTTNLKKVYDYTETLKALNKKDVEFIQMKISKILTVIENSPKSLKWKLRSKIGTKKLWYNPVDKVVR